MRITTSDAITNQYLYKSQFGQSDSTTISPIRNKSLLGTWKAESLLPSDRYISSPFHHQKHRSCSNLEEPISNQFILLTTFGNEILAQVEKKLKNFRFAKENDHNSCASTIAKMKCFCLDNQCFDFYHCTDLILLKYMIFLLIQQINKDESNEKADIPLFKNMVKEAIAIMSQTIDGLKTRLGNTKQIDQLNSQILRMQQAFGIHSTNKLDLLSTVKKIDNKQEVFPKQSNSSQNQEKIIQYQINELQKKNDQIIHFKNKIQELQQENKVLQQQLSENALTVQITQKSLSNKEHEINDLIKKTDKLLTTTSQAMIEKDQIQRDYFGVQEEHEQLKTLYDDLQKSNFTMKEECNSLKNEINLQKKQKQQQSSFQESTPQNTQQNKIIMQLIDDGQTLANTIKDISNKILLLPEDKLCPEIKQLQKELILSENQVNQKLNNMYLAQLGKLGSANYDKLQTNLIHNLKLYQQDQDILCMMVTQCDVIERFING